jgi:hypothetical protein
MPEVFKNAQQAAQVLETAIKDLSEFRDAAALQIAQYLRVDSGIELDRMRSGPRSHGPIHCCRSTNTKPGSSTGAA